MNEHLLHPAHAAVRERLRDGHPAATTLKAEWSLDTRQRVLSFLQAGAIEKLALLLEANPAAIAHPVVFHQIFHLWPLSRRPDMGDLSEDIKEGASVDPQELAQAASAGTRKAAQEALQRLVTAWVRRLLPGWTLTRVKYPKKRGRRDELTDSDKMDLFFFHRELLAKMKQLPPMAFRRKAGEDSAAFIRRVASVVQRLAMPRWDRPIPAARVLAIVSAAVRVRDVQKDLLVYGVVGYYWNRSTGSVKGLIQRVKRDYPDLRDW